jgi:predicted DNA-binding transcriptional regulator YafY
MEQVDERALQHDMQDLVDIPDAHVVMSGPGNRPRYGIEKDLRQSLELPLERNGVLAFFLLKRLQTFFAPNATGLADLSSALTDLDTEKNSLLFEDVDAKLASETFIFGQQSVLPLGNSLFDTLLQGLIERKKLSVEYNGNYHKSPASLYIWPLKVVLYDGALYFACVIETDQSHVFFLKLCRITQATIKEETFEVTPAIEELLKNRLERGTGLMSRNEPVIKNVELRMEEILYRHFTEKKFHKSQTIEAPKDGWFTVRLEVPIDPDLTRWVRGWGKQAIVLAPEELRNEMRETAEKWRDWYKTE